MPRERGKGYSPPGPALHACLPHWLFCTAFYAAKTMVCCDMLRYAVISCTLRRYDCKVLGGDVCSACNVRWAATSSDNSTVYCCRVHVQQHRHTPIGYLYVQQERSALVWCILRALDLCLSSANNPQFRTGQLVHVVYLRLWPSRGQTSNKCTVTNLLILVLILS